MIRASILLALGIIVRCAPVGAQEPAGSNPDAVRLPVLLSFSPVTRQQEVIRLYFAELRRAIQTGDTTTLSVLAPIEVIPTEERTTARRAGCPSIGAAMNRAEKRSAAAGGWSAVVLRQVGVLAAAQGDTVAVGTAQLSINGRTTGLSVALTRSGNARSMGRVRGVLLGLCRVPAVANGNASAGPSVRR